MFKKKPMLKSLAPLRSSDRRRLVDQIIHDYQLKLPKDNRRPSEQNGGPGINTFRNALLPEGALCANFTTTTGPELKVVKGTVYVGAHLSGEQRVLWIKLDDGRIVPTVYTLWRHPDLLPLLHTPEIVVQKMREGADLNTPGLACGPPFPVKAVRGATVAIASYEQPSVPLVVGICEIDVSALKKVQGQKGHAVRPIHSEGDEVWNWSQSGHGGDITPKHIVGRFARPEEVDDATGRLDELESDDNVDRDGEGGVPLELADLQDKSQSNNETRQLEQLKDPKQWTTQEVDATFRSAFLYALHHARTHNKNDPHHGLNFPISQSQLVSNIITPYLPIFTPEDAAMLQIKKTSWKSVKKFIKALDKEKLVKSKDRNGCETIILDIDFDDRAVLSFLPYRLPKKGIAGAEAISGTAGQSSVVTDASIGQQLKRLSLLKPKASLAAIFGNSGTHSLYLPEEVKPIVSRYVEEEALIDTSNRRLVKLNPVLANAVFDSHSSLDQELLAKGSVPRDVLTDKIIQACSPHWIILRNKESRDSAKPKAGQPPSVKIQLETRTGNKTATKVSGLELYHVNVQALADELQKACASSTSIGQLVGSSPKPPAMEILVQGQQLDAVLKALAKRGVRKDWVEVIDKTKGKKK